MRRNGNCVADIHTPKMHLSRYRSGRWAAFHCLSILSPVALSTHPSVSSSSFSSALNLNISCPIIVCLKWAMPVFVKTVQLHTLVSASSPNLKSNSVAVPVPLQREADAAKEAAWKQLQSVVNKISELAQAPQASAEGVTEA